MPKWLLVIKQRSGGCDYTIGCGVAYETFAAENEGSALGVAKARLDEHALLGCRTNDQPSAVLLLPADDAVDVPFEEWIAERAELQAAHAAKTEEENERAILARLKRKYEGSAPDRPAEEENAAATLPASHTWPHDPSCERDRGGKCCCFDEEPRPAPLPGGAKE